MDRIIINHKSKCVRVWCGGKNAKQIYFSATEYGSLNSAFLAAVEYKKKLPVARRRGRKKPRLKAHADNQMGIVGVCPRWHRGEFKGYRAHWVEYIDGLPKRKTQDFYFSVYGNADLDRAILCRKLHAGT